MKAHLVSSLTLFLIVSCLVAAAEARNPIRRAFFNVYTSAENTRLDNLPSNAGHCGVCHFDFDGGGTRNPYGLSVEVAINSGLFATKEDAIQSLENNDADGDGHSNLIEITSVIFTNTPTFPGLTSGFVGAVLNVDVNDIQNHLTPTGSTDTTPPTVTVLSPNGGEAFPGRAMAAGQVTWTATDANGIAYVNLDLSDDGGVTYKPFAHKEPNDGVFDWFVPNLPGSQNIVRVTARDNGGNYGSDESDGTCTITPVPPPYLVPTTMRDVELPGTQPATGVVLEDPDLFCASCHGNYNTAEEPWYQWRGSLMAQAMRDPLFLACLAVAEQDAPSVGDLCLRCHTPGGWMEGRSVDTGGGLVNQKDRQAISCDFCHRLVDPDYKPGVSPPEDQAVLNALDEIPLAPANGQYVADPNPIRRGPFSDANASHPILVSPWHQSDLCGTCHDVSNPAFVAGATPGDYVPQAFDTPHPDGDLRNMFPIERTFSEWSVSEYATPGVFAPQFAGNKADGIVSTCQDCHQADVQGKGCNEPGVPTRDDLPLHDFTGGNYFIADILPDFYPTEVDVGQLQAAKQLAIGMLQKAATMALDAKVYEIKPGLSPGLAAALGLPAGDSFHFVVNDTIYFDNRIPPRGFTNANFETVQSPPVAYTYADGQYWDETFYTFPEEAVFAEVTLYYQTVSKEYIEFLRDENVTNSMGQDLYNAWDAQGKCAPVAMVSDTTTLYVDPTGIGDTPLFRTALYQNAPNPFNPSTVIRYSLEARRHVRIDIFDVSGRVVRTLVDEARPAGNQTVEWDGTNANGHSVASGMYFYRMTTDGQVMIRKAMLLK
jgi:hypothetical protein